MSYNPPDLTADELAALAAIGRQIRHHGRGLATGRHSLASVLAGREARRVNASLRALCALPDLKRPQQDTFEWVARGLGQPAMAAAWWAAWQSIPHPRRDAP